MLIYFFDTVESSQKVSSSEIPKLSEDLKNRDRKLDDIENGERGLNKLWSNLTEINKKVSFSLLHLCVCVFFLILLLSYTSNRPYNRTMSFHLSNSVCNVFNNHCAW